MKRNSPFKKQPQKQFYMTIAVRMKRGGTELRRFHVGIDPRTLAADDQNSFLVWTLMQVGIRVEDVADLGSEPPVALAVWDTEADCKSAYDAAVAHTHAERIVGR